MPQFKTARMNDDTAISSVDDGLGIAETATANILGVPVNTEISNSIFGGVDSSGRITGDGDSPAKVPSIYNESGSEAQAASMEFVSKDGSNDIGWRITPVGGELGVWERDPSTENSGNMLQNLALPRLLTNLDDCDLTDLEDDAGQVLAIDSNSPYHIIAVDAIPPGSGSPSYIGLNDTPINWTGVVDGMVPVVVVDDPALPVQAHLEFTAGGGNFGGDFIDLGDTYDEHVGKKQAQICVAEDEGGLVASFQRFARSYNPNAQYCSSGLPSVMIDWGDADAQFPVAGNSMVQGQEIIFLDEVDRDSVYQVNYSVRVTHNAAALNKICIWAYSGSINGILVARHENIMSFYGPTDPNAPPITMNGSFMATVPFGTHSAASRTLNIAIGRIKALNTPILGGGWQYDTGTYQIGISYAEIEICKVN